MMGSKPQNIQGTVLLIQAPKTNDKRALAAEQLFASLRGLLTSRPKGALRPATRLTLSLEIAVINRSINFYVWVPSRLKQFVEEQIYAQYPSVKISEVPDYAMAASGPAQVTSRELSLRENSALSIKTFQSFDVDPLAAITATLTELTDNEQAWLQLIIRPTPPKWQSKNERYIAKLRSGQTWSKSLSVFLGNQADNEQVRLSERQRLRLASAEEKSHKLSYEATLRLLYQGNTEPEQARLRLQAIAASYQQFDSTHLNGFSEGREINDWLALESYRLRAFGAKPFVLNTEEVATLYHLPHTNVETPRIGWADSREGEPPPNLPAVIENLPIHLSPMAVTNFRDRPVAFGLPRSDRGRHLYILGQTGVGKSGLLELLTISDIFAGEGFGVIDPHGDYAKGVLRRMPEERVADIVYFNAADTDFPIAFNPLEHHGQGLRHHICSELITALKRIFESWGPRLEHVLRYSILALLDYPEATMLDITRILTDKSFRSEVLRHVNDPLVRSFWSVEFAGWNDRFAAEAIAPVLNKVGAFTANPLIRNIIGQPKSSINMRQIMDEGKCLVVNLSRGLIGEDNASLLGALLITKLQMAAMSRADTDPDKRPPFYLYVDEFQNFATDSFVTILSEARKYGLYLTVANQYISQMTHQVRDAVFGNVGSIASFRLGADDAGIMQRYFEPVFAGHDLVHLHNRHFVLSMTISGEKAAAFSCVTLDLPPAATDYTEQIIYSSRSQYGVNKQDVERLINGQCPAKKSPQKPQAKPRFQSRPDGAPYVGALGYLILRNAAAKKARRKRRAKKK